MKKVGFVPVWVKEKQNLEIVESENWKISGNYKTKYAWADESISGANLNGICMYWQRQVKIQLECP